MTEKRIARGDTFHIAYEPEGRLYVRLGQNPGFIMGEKQAREFFEGLKGVMDDAVAPKRA